MRNLQARGLFLSSLVLFLIAFSNPNSSILSAQSSQAQNFPGSVIFVSNDRGENWTAVGSVPDVRTFVIDPVNTSIIYAGSSAGLYKSIDGGVAWSAINNGLPGEFVNGLVIDPKNTNILYLGTGNQTYTGAVYKSTDGGALWVKSSNGLMNNGQSYIYSLAIDPSNSSIVYAGTSHGLFKSDDSGANWNLISSGLISGAHGQSALDEIRNFVIDPSNPDVLYVSTSNRLTAGISPRRLGKSIDGGRSWRSGGKSGTVDSIVIDPLNSSTLYAGLSQGIGPGVLKSTDGAERWQTILEDGSVFGGIIALAIDPATPSTIYAGVNKRNTLKNGIYRSANGGATWIHSSNGLPDIGVSALAIDPRNPSRVYVATVPSLANVSAASYLGEELAQESIVAMFGQGLATETQQATSTPLPVSLANTSVKVKDSKGVERSAALFFVSPTQINYQIPPDTALGDAYVTIYRSSEPISVGTTLISKIGAGFFSADSTGKGLAAAVVVRVKADGTTSYEAVARFDETEKRFVAIPIDLGAETDQVFLALFGVGWRHLDLGYLPSAKIGDVDAPVVFAGAQPMFVGLDQMNLRAPRSLAGRGEVEVVATIGLKKTNIVKVDIK